MKPGDGSTVIGKSVVIRGELSGSEDLYMDGEIEGSIRLTESRLTVGPNAVIRANLEVRDVVVFGRIDGNVKATGRMELRQTAVVVGDVVASRLSVEESAVIKGRVELSGTGAPANGQAKSVPQGTPPLPRPAASQGQGQALPLAGKEQTV